MPRNENDSSKMNSNTSTSAPAKTHGRFKFNPKPSRANVAPIPSDLNKNAKITTEKIDSISVQNVSTASNGSDCMIIDEEEHGFSTVKSVLAKEKEDHVVDDDDDIFENFSVDDLKFTKITTKKKEDAGMDDLYAKYGSPKPKSTNTLDTFDIDKQLNSNASYVNAMKKLDENMKQLRASPMKNPIAGKRFKYNAPSKSGAAIGKSISPPAVVNSSGLDTAFKPARVPNQISNYGMLKPSTATSNITSISRTSTNSSTSIASSFDTPVLKPYKPIQPVDSPVENSSRNSTSSP